MKVLKIKNYEDIKNIKGDLYTIFFGESDYIIDLEECSTSNRKRVIDFLSGLVYLNGTLEKINKNQFAIKMG